MPPLLVPQFQERLQHGGVGREPAPPVEQVAGQRRVRQLALAVAGVADRVAFRRADLLDGVDGPLDAIVANPPYVIDRTAPALQPEVRDHEPAVALFGGADGLGLVTRLVADAPTLLCPGGLLVFEFGFGQDVEVETLLATAPDLTLVDVRRDLDGIARTAVGQKR